MNIKKLFSIILVLTIILTLFTPTVTAQIPGTNIPNLNPSVGQWYVSPQGNDNKSCTSPSAPCATIMAALRKAGDGEIIYIAVGTYTRTEGTSVVLVEKSISLSGGWDASFSRQDGYTTIDAEWEGEGILAMTFGSISLDRLVVEHGDSGFPVSGIYSSQATMFISNSVIQENQPGGIYNDRGTMTIIDSVIWKNGNMDYGAGIINDGPLTMIRSSVNHNMSSRSGGGIRHAGSTLTLINSTVSENTAPTAGGIVIEYGTAEIYNSTIIKNIATKGVGGIDVNPISSLLIQNSIVAENSSLAPGGIPDCTGTINSGGYNLLGASTGCNFIPTIGDLLDIPPLAVRIGPYYALRSNSPAIDAGNPSGCLDDQGAPIIVDQRGSSRPIDGNQDGVSVCDIGAYELDPSHPFQICYFPFIKNACPFLYQDDFSNPWSGWPVGDTGNVLFEYNNGEYRILIRPTNYIAAVRPGFVASDYKVSVDLRNSTGDMGSYGIIFGLSQDWWGFYSLEIYPDGYFGVYRYAGSSLITLDEAYSPAINQGTAKNHISITRNGALINAYANGQLLTSLTDSTFIGNRYLGLINFTYNQPNIDVRYDNFRVYQVDCQDITNLTGVTHATTGAWFDRPQNSTWLQPVSTKHQP